MSYVPTTKLVSMNFGGNLHDVAGAVNKFGWADFFLHAQGSGYNSVALFRFPLDWPCDDHGPLTISQIHAKESKEQAS